MLQVVSQSQVSYSAYYRAIIWEIRGMCSPYWQTLLCMDFAGGLQCQDPSLFYLFMSLWETPCQPWQLCHLLPVMPLTGISSHPRFPAGSVKQLISSQVISQPLLLVSWRWYSRNHYLELRTFLYPCPHLPQQEELSNPVFSAMEKLFPNKAGRRHFFSR